MLGYVLPAIAITAAGAVTASAEIALSLPLSAEASLASQVYQCGEDEPIKVHYINDAQNALALVPIDGKTVIFVSAISGSGARYVSGSLVWWSKGTTATLEDEMIEDSLQECPAA